jgi:hypothetical protein
MQVNSYYDRETKAWWAYVTDADGIQLGNAVAAHTLEDAVFQLGREVGSSPEKFARPLSNYFDMKTKDGKTLIQI